MTLDPIIAVYALPLAAMWLAHAGINRRRTKRALEVLTDNQEAGLTEPPSLHPIIDPAHCLGCAACIKACPEKSILGLIDGKAALIEPTMCVGHGACQVACPTDAIELVFGTATRGVDIPLVSPNFESSVAGIYIAGELGGMGLIRNAIEQGRQAIESIAERAAQIPDAPGVLDVLIVGCGPAGIAASLGAIERNLSYLTIDQSTLGGTVAHFPRGKLVMTAPAQLPLVGEVKFSEVSKEKLLSFWEGVIAKNGLEAHFEEQVRAVAKEGDYFEISTDKGSYRAKTVLLAIGRRGTPRTLGVPGEELEKVVYRLIDPEQYKGQNVLIVGGGDSALEAATSIAEQAGTHVTISYRGEAYARARKKNREKLAQMASEGRITEMLESTVEKIERSAVSINCADGAQTIANDSVIICAGGILPTKFLEEIGISVEKKFGTA